MKNQNNWLYNAYRGAQVPTLKLAHKRFKKANFIYDSFEIPQNITDYGKGKLYFVRTYGCQANLRDSENISGILEAVGYKPTQNVKEAHFILLNTCAVRENAEKKVYGELGLLSQIKRARPDILFALAGCMTQEPNVVKKIMDKIPYLDIVFGTHNIFRLPQLIEFALFAKETVIEVWSKEGDIVENTPDVRDSKIKAWVNIMFGCNYFCTYCIIPYTRGKERSRKTVDVIKEIENLVKDGYQEVTLLGQNVNSYGKDLIEDIDFRKLLVLVSNTGIARIRFTTSNPWNFPVELITTITKHRNIMPHIHLPMQSGSSAVLKRMARRNTTEEYLTIVDNLKTLIPNLSLTTDIIVGFPNETQEEFQETLDVYDKVQFDNAYTFIYSQREGTPAAEVKDNISFKIKNERLQKLNEKVKLYAKKNNQKYQDRTIDVLVEGNSKKNNLFLTGHSDTNKVVNFSGEKKNIGKIIKVKITDAKNFTLDGVEIA